MFIILALTLPAHAADTCEDLCSNLDAADETCESYFGDGDAFCETIGVVDDEYCPDGGDFDGACSDMCEDVDTLDEACDESLGEAHAVCQALDYISETCEDDGYLDDEEDEDETDADDGEGSDGEGSDGEGSDDEDEGSDGDTTSGPDQAASAKSVENAPGAAVCGTQSTPLAPVIGLAAAAALFTRRRRA